MPDHNQNETVINRIISAAIENPEFRQKLVADPKKALENHFKFKFPDNYEIVVHEDNPKKFNIVLPLTSDELSEAELSAVSGGMCWDDCDDYGCYP